MWSKFTNLENTRQNCLRQNTKIMTEKKLVNCTKTIPGHFQDKTLKIVNSRTEKNSMTFPGFGGFPGRVDTLWSK